MADARTATVLASVLPIAPFWAAAMLATVLLQDNFHVTYRTVTVTQPANPTASAPFTPYTYQAPEYRPRTLGETWEAWHANGPIGPAELAFAGLAALVPLLIVFFAWLVWPMVHAGDSPALTFGRAFRATAALAGPFFLFSIGISALYFWSRAYVGPFSNLARQLAPIFAPVLPGATSAVLIWLLERLARGAALADDVVHVSPICENCGYDLSHVSADGRCTECGVATDRSLAANPRGPTAWERATGIHRFAGWFSTSIAALVAPGSFYSTISAGGHRASGFAAHHLVAIGLLSCVYAVIGLASEFRTLGEWNAIAPGMILVGAALLVSVITHGRFALKPLWFLGTALSTAVAVLIARHWAGYSPFSEIALLAAILTALWLVSVFAAWRGFRRLAPIMLSSGTAAFAYGVFPLAHDMSYEWYRWLPLMMITLVPPLVGWLAWRVIGALVATGWIIVGKFHIPQVIRKVLSYEIAYLWIPWTYAAVLVASFIAWNDWISRLIGRSPRFAFGVPYEVLILFGGLACFAIAWIYRLTRIARHIRWTNR